jgi:hypothetical protein
VTPPAWAWVETIYGIASVPIASELVTRGYNRQDFSRWSEMRMQLETWSPNITITVIRDGKWEESPVRSHWTRSRTKYFRPFNKTPWVSTNANGDHATPGREDYSVALGDAGLLLGTVGVQTDIHQAWEVPLRLSARGAFSQLRIVNESGRIKVGLAAVSAASPMLGEEAK